MVEHDLVVLPRTRSLTGRRLLVLALNVASFVGIALMAGHLAAAAGWRIVDMVLFLCVLMATPWVLIGFWNAVIGLLLAHGLRNGLEQAAPFLRGGREEKHLVGRTAILMTLRNEDPARAVARLKAVKADLDATAYGHGFDYFLLSDTARDDIAAAEEAEVARWCGEEPGRRIHYRRRENNEGFKAGNIRDFCTRWGASYDYMLPLDADSVMGASAILFLVRILDAHPRIGILQSLVVGMPSVSAFARIFQFGMRHGMRCYTLGATWWTGDCGPFWGHNALVRIRPFYEHCHLPILPGTPPLGGPILSHDQVEAVLMRRAGYEVRVVPVEGESYEENPPTIAEFVARDLRWCLGNMQYLRLQGLPGLKPISRFQLLWAVLMFAGVPAVPLALALLPFAATGLSPEAAQALGSGLAWLYVGLLLLGQFPKLAGLADVALTPGGMARYGGALRFLGSAALEMVFSLLLGAITALATTRFLLGLAFGRAKAGWNGQVRDAHALSLAAAWQGLWVQTVFGVLVGLGLALTAPVLLLWTLPLLAGCWLAVPFAVLSAAPRVGAFLSARGICAIPEEQVLPAILRRVAGAEADAQLGRVA
ncbi:glucans biosynthesis glucosyltransferase H [Azorhizobium oxalatiphilum]|uniref:Glucans biosynthesis glucosyltransferase H n=1 Tax=Azorhizobium oxalatiphilum TaxID=980631 RepID=A0A917BJI5_9HYPH|nr:glucans biosynthesis glucosyltransferase MdoH [Azorhizobium oxalatiphilum]GGF46660.1 glucans biosynthesis glucosyltransferase H [Azorhizobium oxalatiphilum]